MKCLSSPWYCIGANKLTVPIFHIRAFHYMVSSVNFATVPAAFIPLPAWETQERKGRRSYRCQGTCMWSKGEEGQRYFFAPSGNRVLARIVTTS